MKTVTILLFFLTCSIINVQAQLLELGNKWLYEYRDYTIGNGDYSENIDSITVVDQVEINGLQYYKVVASQVSPCGIFTETEFLREEDDRIYRLSADMSGEQLMIDFNDQNSYPMTYEANFQQKLVNTTVYNDSVGLLSLPSGRDLDITYQHIANNESFEGDVVYSLSEEIGYVGNYGMLFPDIGTGLCDVNQILNLRCMISGNDTIRLTELDCYQPSKTLDLPICTSDVLDVYPNPTTGTLTISHGYKVLSLQDISGKKFDFYQDQNRVDISHLPQGLYYLIFQNEMDQQLRSFKVVKI